MNKRGIFGMFIMFVLLVLLLIIWASIQESAIGPAIDAGLAGTVGATHADGVEFFLRMIPWAVPLIFIIGMLWMGATR